MRISFISILAAHLALAPALSLAQEREPAAVAKAPAVHKDWGKVTRDLVKQSQGHKAIKLLPKVWRDRWSVEKSELFLPTGEKGRSEFFSRYLSDGVYYLSIGQIQFSEVPRKLKAGRKKSDEAQEIAAQIQKILVGDWQKRERAGVYIYETLIPKQNRVYRLWIEPQDNVFRVSMSSFRPLYMMPLLLESEVMHRALHTPEGKAVAAHWDEQDKSVAGLLRQFQEFARKNLLPEAIAQMGMPFGGVGGAPVQQILGGLQGVGDRLGGTLEGYQPIVGRFLDRTSGQVTEGLQLGRDALGTANRGIRAAEDATRQAGESTRVFDRESQAWRQQVDRESQAWQRQTDRAMNESEAWRREFRRVSSLENVFMTGFVAASGAALGAMAANVVVSVAGSAISGLYYSITGTLTPDARRELNDQGRQALADLEQQSARMVEMEMRADRTIAALVWATQQDPNTLAASQAQLAATATGLEFEIRQMEERMMRMDRSSPQFRQCLLDLNRRRDEKKAIDVLVQTVSQYGNGASMIHRICADIQRMLTQWINIEGSLHQASTMFMGSVRVLMGQLLRRARSAQNSLGSSNRAQDNECRRAAAAWDGSSLSDQRMQHLHTEMVSQILQSCDDVGQAVRNFDTEQNTVMGGSYLSSQLAALATQTRELSRSFCAEDDTSGGCDGQVGKFRDLVNRWNMKLTVAARHCPNLASMTERQLPRDTGATPASIRGTPLAQVEDHNRPSFLGRAWSAIGRAFDWAFGWLG